MSGTFRCPLCGQAHASGTVVCPESQLPLPRSAPQAAGRELVVPRPAAGQPAAPHGSTRRSLLGQTVDGKYRVMAMLGEGGMGAVFEAEHTAIGRVVAMKVLHPAQARKTVAVKRFHQEARAAGGIGHPNICEVFDFGTLPDGSPYLVMERLRGETLAARILAEAGLPIDEVLEFTIQVLAGLGAAHDHGILHRDIKPENVFLAERPNYPPIAKLLDFGVSKVVTGGGGDWDDESALTKTGMVMGTPYYMSPEQARGDRNLDGRLDLYAVGVVLYEALTGHRPFTAKNYNALLVNILSATPAPPSSLRAAIPAELERIILKAMSKNREDRFGSASEFSRALAGVRRELAKATTGGATFQPTLGAPTKTPISAEIPILFADTGGRTPAPQDHADRTTKPVPDRPASEPLPDGASPYDDEPGQDETIRMDTAEDPAPPPRAQGDVEEKTEKMNSRDIQAIVSSLREARDRERGRQG